jgi:hypothetical protein
MNIADAVNRSESLPVKPAMVDRPLAYTNEDEE